MTLFAPEILLLVNLTQCLLSIWMNICHFQQNCNSQFWTASKVCVMWEDLIWIDAVLIQLKLDIMTTSLCRHFSHRRVLTSLHFLWGLGPLILYSGHGAYQRQPRIPPEVTRAVHPDFGWAPHPSCRVSGWGLQCVRQICQSLGTRLCLKLCFLFLLRS